ncbi:hypothetical protein [Treponema sp.]|uniref:hypothetical protein n=1 Tax=Treponema sp. TaxID=166 RepID=UPI0025FA3A55|nr:hypothetical protein [Treponema sp.]MCR5217280.1 hypothetical protein [Treponema sp.]
MERHLFSLIFSVFTAAAVFSQAPSQIDQLRIQVWADLDPIPGLFEEDGESVASGADSDSKAEPGSSVKDSINSDNSTNSTKSDNSTNPDNSTNAINSTNSANSTNSTNSAESEELSLKEKVFHQKFDFAINRTKEIAPFLMSGMLDGWYFEYTPYDKARKVDEYWDFKEIMPFNSKVNTLTYNSPEVEEDRLVCWVYCNRTESQKKAFKSWNSIVHPHIHGKGAGNVQDGFKGIQDAVSEAAKNAVREYWRMYIKNKPKEISGKVLLIRNPRIYIKGGQYIVDLDFFMETDRIVLYNYY